MKPSIHALILCVAALACCSPARSQNQDPAALLGEVWAAHGVTAALLEAHVQFHGSYYRGDGSIGDADSLLIKQRGYDTFRIEIHGKKSSMICAQHQGARWSRKDNEAVRDYDGRYSLNLPLMDSPSTGLLAYLLANGSRIVYLSNRQDSFEGRAAIRLLLKVPDNDPDRIRPGVRVDRHFELIVDAASRQLLLASMLATPGMEMDRENYRYSNYLNENHVLFPGRVSRSIGPLAGPFSAGKGSTLEIDKVQLNQNFKDDDFKRPQ